MKKNYYGYMRVSSIDQNIERQRQELLRWGIVEKHIYADKLSGKDFKRQATRNCEKGSKRGMSLW